MVETLHHEGVLLELFRHHFDRNRPIERGLHSLVDDSHSALADLLDLRVARKRLPGGTALDRSFDFDFHFS